MAASSSRADRVYHQDYIARIRYSNTLPPPPNPPKLLNIPNTGIANGQYTSAAYASRLAREQPLNIEADAELGMPINLIGMPGVFDGDESSIYALDNPPPPHPHDKPLLRPLSMLGKAGSLATGVSFLRRTEYISADQGQLRFESNKNRDQRLKQELRKRKRPELERDDPIRIVRAVVKAFDTAYPHDASTDPEIRGPKPTPAETAAWEQPRHPKEPELTLLDTYPVLPDLGAFPDSTYFLTRFITNPALNINVYDSRLDVALLRPLDPGPDAIAQLEAQRAAHDADPTQPPPGSLNLDYEYFLPQDTSITSSILSKFAVGNPNNDDDALYDGENKETGKRFFRYGRVRTYETYKQTGDTTDTYGDTVAVALHDADDELDGGRLQRAAYYYPIMQKTYVRPRRPLGASQQEEEGKVDYLEVVVREPDEAEMVQREVLRAALDVVDGVGEGVGEEGDEA